MESLEAHHWAVSAVLTLQLPISVWRRRCDAGSLDEIG